MILQGQIFVIMKQTLTFDLVMKAHQMNYPVITGKLALFSRDNGIVCLVTKNELIYPVITGK